MTAINTNYTKKETIQKAFELGFYSNYSGLSKCFYFKDSRFDNRSLKIVCWWSGGVTSAVACKLAIEKYGLHNCELIMIDAANNEDSDTYRFKRDCEQWYGKEISTRSNPKYQRIQDVWLKFGGMNYAHGAICSSELKRWVREQYERANLNTTLHQVFGFDNKENKRALSMLLNYPKSRPIFPLIDRNLSKTDCIEIIQNANIQIPRMYMLGFHNNNCFETGCVQAGIGYWQKMHNTQWLKYFKMGLMEHHLTNLKGKPVTICKDQSKKAKLSGLTHVFLLPHPNYPNHKTVMDMKGRKVKPLFECNGFCGTNDLNDKNPTELEVIPSL